MLGVLGAVAPCQISANMGAISYTTNRMVQGKKWQTEVISFFIGKTLVYFLLGMLIIGIGNELEALTIPVFQVVRKITGPVLLVTGLYFIGWIKVRGLFTERLLNYRSYIDHLSGNTKAFALGVLLSLAFCPTMFFVFFGLLTPLMLNTAGYGLALPFLFSIGTIIPVLLFLGLAFGMGLDQKVLKRSKKIGRVIQVIAGIVLVIIGVNDIILYWTLS